MTHGFEPPVCIRTQDPRELESLLASNLRPVSIKPCQRDKQSFLFQQLKLKDSQISVLQGEGAMDVKLNPERDKPASYIFWMQIDGSCRMNPEGERHFEIPAFHGCIASSSTPGSIRQSTNSRQFFIRFQRSSLEGNLEENSLPFRALDQGIPVRLPSLMGSALHRYIQYLMTEFRQSQSPVWEPELSLHTEHLLIALLKEAWTRRQDGTAGGLPAAWEPQYVVKAEKFILQNFARGITIEDLVAETGVSLRTLYRGFNLHKGRGPMSFLRDTRLERVHAELLQADPRDTSVTEIAFRSGFDHLSNFASLYRNRFGRLPSETLVKKLI